MDFNTHILPGFKFDFKPRYGMANFSGWFNYPTILLRLEAVSKVSEDPPHPGA